MENIIFLTNFQRNKIKIIKIKFKIMIEVMALEAKNQNYICVDVPLLCSMGRFNFLLLRWLYEILTFYCIFRLLYVLSGYNVWYFMFSGFGKSLEIVYLLQNIIFIIWQIFFPLRRRSDSVCAYVFYKHIKEQCIIISYYKYENNNDNEFNIKIINMFWVLFLCIYKL